MISDDISWALRMHEFFGLGDAAEIATMIELLGNPWPKHRPRFSRKGGRAFHPREDEDAEKKTAFAMKCEFPHRLRGNVVIACRFYRGDDRRADADNLMKHVMDAAKGILWDDDSQVTASIAEVQYDATRPRTIVMAARHSSSLRRGDDRMQKCAHCEMPYMPKRKDSGYCSGSCSRAARKARGPGALLL